MLMTSKVELPKKKPNHFYILNRKKDEYIEVKYLSQHELADGWKQIVSRTCDKKLVNHFSVTLAFLPEQFWKRLRKVKSNGDDSYKVIIDGITRYTIIETNQDETMINLFNELLSKHPNVSLLNKYINDLDVSQHTSWLVLRAKHYINTGKLYNEHYVTME
jgi:hypothetical protein